MEAEPSPRLQQYWIVEYSDGIPTKVHHVVNPVLGERGWYVCTTSTEAFGKREIDRLLKAERKREMQKRRFSVRRCCDWKLDLKSKLTGYAGLPIEERGTIFDFYKHIGFDHKKNRYVEGTQECPVTQ